MCGRREVQGRCGGAQVYYFNTITSESSWSEPEGYTGDAPAATAAAAISSTRCKGTRWSEVLCSDGRKYYQHLDTGVGPAASVLRFVDLLCQRFVQSVWLEVTGSACGRSPPAAPDQSVPSSACQAARLPRLHSCEPTVPSTQAAIDCRNAAAFRLCYGALVSAQSGERDIPITAPAGTRGCTAGGSDVSGPCSGLSLSSRFSAPS